ncbi:ATP-binding cassette domain-containing protein [Paenibacillus sp. TRM 82003]|nr:ATP-binding cassette domain-containing protein [Paenibacillus sp. TRM 82003]
MVEVGTKISGAATADTILDIRGLTKAYEGQRRGTSVTAVRDITLSIRRGETFSLVGESGCGKTTLGRCIVRGIEATGGAVSYARESGETVDFLTARGQTYRDVRKEIQMIFQDPYSSLNPRMTVFDIIAEPLRANEKLSRAALEERVKAIAAQTGLNPSFLQRYPHAFSGGQRQRIGIARALVTKPRVVVCDEAVSALDVSIQAQIINLLKDLQREYGMTYIFISHDLSVVGHISDRVAVMYLGRVVETAPTRELFERPLHPYTEALLSAVPKPDPEAKSERIVLQGEVPSPANPPSGCVFHPRCAYATERCEREAPTLAPSGADRAVACHYGETLGLRGIFTGERAGTA